MFATSAVPISPNDFIMEGDLELLELFDGVNGEFEEQALKTITRSITASIVITVFNILIKRLSIIGTPPFYIFAIPTEKLPPLPPKIAVRGFFPQLTAVIAKARTIATINKRINLRFI